MKTVSVFPAGGPYVVPTLLSTYDSRMRYVHQIHDTRFIWRIKSRPAYLYHVGSRRRGKVETFRQFVFRIERGRITFYHDCFRGALLAYVQTLIFLFSRASIRRLPINSTALFCLAMVCIRNAVRTLSTFGTRMPAYSKT